MDKKNQDSNPTQGWCKWRREDLIIMGILAGLAFLISFSLSSPSLSMNDESITVNQLHQLYYGTDILINEGKYGTMFSGEISSYYQKRNNYLAYSLFLPVLSLPVLYVIDHTGDAFRLLFIFFFGFIGILTLLGCLHLTSVNENKLMRGILVLSILLFTLFFFINILLYTPFPAGKDQPVETAAVVFTNGMLFSLMAPLSYGLFHPFLKDSRLSIIAVVIMLGSSSFMIWADTAKDHLAVAFLLLLLLYVYSRIVWNPSPGLWTIFFTISGLMIWARTEYGIWVSLFLFCWYLWVFRRKVSKPEGNYSVKKILMSIYPGLLGIGLGLLPFLYNNLITTRNLFIPPQYLYISGSYSAANIVSEEIKVSDSVMVLQSEGIRYVLQAIHYFIPKGLQISDLFGVFFNPANGAAGILFIAPLVIPAILYFYLNYKKNKQFYSSEMRELLLFSLIILFITLFAYLRTITGSNINPGMFPDMRYFSLMYLPLNIISIILLYPALICVKERFLKTFFGLIILFPLLLIGCIFFILPNGIYNFISPLEKISWLFILVSGFIILFARKRFLLESVFFNICVLLICIPITFQIIIMIVFGILAFNGYTFWLPFMEKMSAIIMMVVGN